MTEYIFINLIYSSQAQHSCRIQDLQSTLLIQSQWNVCARRGHRNAVQFNTESLRSYNAIGLSRTSADYKVSDNSRLSS